VDEDAPLLGSAGRYSSYDSIEENMMSRGLPSQDNSPHFCSVCCSILSLSAFVFLMWIALYASFGWNYQQNGWKPTQIHSVQQNCVGAAMLWLGSAAISLFYWNRALSRSSSIRHQRPEHGKVG
jgi:hypothetical protein